MSGGTAFLRGPSYLLGEREADYPSIDNLDELTEKFGLAPNAGLWGWGTIRTSERDLEEMAVDTGTATLRAAGLDASSVDALVLCSNRIPGVAEGHGRFVQRVLTGIGLPDIPCYGQYLNRCVNMLAGLDVARAFVLSGRHRRVLLITTDKVADGAGRMSQFAMFSDGAASCVVTADDGAADEAGQAGQAGEASQRDCYQLLGCATAQDTASLEWTSQISSDLARTGNDALLTPAGLKVGDLSALMHANLFKPLLVMKERQGGVSPEQLYTGNIGRFGHCFAADPLINLVDRVAIGHLGEGDYCQLA